MVMENNSNVVMVVVEGKEEKCGCFGDGGGGDKRIEIWCWWC